uniref:Uncharacterized protein n=1 Tax=Sphaerodactylus townsendi TaxID=933632 RepID=A0ACB8FIP5_9SAUR
MIRPFQLELMPDPGKIGAWGGPREAVKQSNPHVEWLIAVCESHEAEFSYMVYEETKAVLELTKQEKMRN